MNFNMGYLTGITGKPSEYLTKGSRLILTNKNEKEKVLKSLTDLIEEVKPDILFLSEIRDEPCMIPVRNLFAKSYIDSKYKPESFLNFLPFFRGNCNGVFLRNSLPVKKLFMKSGSKKLVYQISITENCSILFSHFALGKQTRSKQFSEISQIVMKNNQSIIAGDFNIFRGIGELEELFKKGNLRLVNNLEKKTFPSYRPSHVIDLFLSSPSIKTTYVKVFDDVLISDHLPVVADFEFRT